MKLLRVSQIICLFCVSTLLAVKSRAQLPTITNQPISQTVWAGGHVTFVAGISGAGPYTYQWQCDTTNLPNGIITTVAGGGTGGLGDGGTAINASLTDPSIVAFDASGNMFIADNGNNRIRKVSINGIITTVAGGGVGGGTDGLGDGGAATNAEFNDPYCVAFDASGNMFITDFYNYCIRKVNTNGIITSVVGNGSSIISATAVRPQMLVYGP